MFKQFLTPAHIRTAVPTFVGSALSYLFVHNSFAHQWFTTFDKLNPQWRGSLSVGVTSATIFVYYSGARYLGNKNPKLEKLLLGSSQTPTYSGK